MGTGPNSKAADYFARIRDHYAKRLAPNDPQLARINFDLGRALENSDAAKAKIAFESAITIYEHQTGEPNPDYIRALYHLGYVESNRGERHAKSIYEKALKESEARFGADSPVTGEALIMMGQYYLGVAAFDESKESLTRALSIFDAKLPPTHPLALKAHASLVVVYENLGLSDLSTKECVLLGTLAPDIEGKEDALYRILPEYPAMARFNALEGYVDLRFTVTPQGRVTDAKVIGGNKKTAFTDPVIAAVSQWRYKPRVVNGTPVESTRTFRFSFKTSYHRSSTRIKNEGETN